MNNVLKQEVNSTFDALITIFSEFKEDQVDVIPFEGSWTAGQVAEHIIKAVDNLPEFLENNTEFTARPYDEKVKPIRDLFLNYTIKMNSPEFILPLASKHYKKNILDAFGALQKQMLVATDEMDLALTCMSFEFPGFGFLTRFEWLNFFIVHTQRHTQQLKNIYLILNKKN